MKTARAAVVCDLRPELAQKAASEFGVPRWSGSADEVLADPEIHGVILALPAFARTALAVKAFQQGKHVLTEKPVAMNAAEVHAMIAAQGKLVGACCSSRYRGFESARVATEFLRSGGLGPIRTITCRAVNQPGPTPKTTPPVWRLRRDLNGGGIFVNWGVYDLDYLLGLLDFKLTPQFALARTWQVPPAFSAYAAPGSDAETHITGLVTFAEGCVLTYERAEASTLPAGSIWVIGGEKASLSLQMLQAKSANLVLTEPDPATGTCTRVLWEGDESESTLHHDGVVFDFVDAILEKRAPRTSLTDALLFMRIADAFYRSADSGQPVAVA